MENNAEQKLSISGIISLVIGIVGLITCLIPFVNNATFFISGIGLIVGILAIVGILKGKKRNKIIGFLALGFNILAIILVLVSQSIYSTALNQAANGPQAVSSSSDSGKSNEGKIGDTITLTNKLEITVEKVETGLVNFDGKPIAKVIVKYVNNSDKEVSYNSFDWKSENKTGAQTNSTYYSNAGSDQLNSGKLAPGGSISGSLYFEDPVVKVLYSSGLSQQTAATWIV